MKHNRNDVFEKLFMPTTDVFDILTPQCFEVLFHGILVILERQCVNPLPGGKYWNPSEVMKSIAKNVPATNKQQRSLSGEMV